MMSCLSYLRFNYISYDYSATRWEQWLGNDIASVHPHGGLEEELQRILRLLQVLALPRSEVQQRLRQHHLSDEFYSITIARDTFCT